MSTDPSAVDLGQVRSLVSRAVTAAVPPADVVERKIRPESTFGYPEPRPLAGLRAALLVARLAHDQAYRFVTTLRGEGTSWAAVVELLEIPWSSEYVQAERAYELVAGSYGSSYGGDLRLYWTCGGPGGCGQRITDYGPYNGIPDDCERGHADGCLRLAAEKEAWDREMADREERARIMDEAMSQVTDGFGRETVMRARYVQEHGGRWLGWSTSEALAVALVLGDDERLAAHGCSTRARAVDRVLSALGRPPADPGAWLTLLRAAATGIG